MHSALHRNYLIPYFFRGGNGAPPLSDKDAFKAMMADLSTNVDIGSRWEAVTGTRFTHDHRDKERIIVSTHYGEECIFVPEDRYLGVCKLASNTSIATFWTDLAKCHTTRVRRIE